MEICKPVTNELPQFVRFDLLKNDLCSSSIDRILPIDRNNLTSESDKKEEKLQKEEKADVSHQTIKQTLSVQICSRRGKIFWGGLEWKL